MDKHISGFSGTKRKNRKKVNKMKRFYSNNIQTNFIYLENEEAQHCTKVLRCKENETVEVLNGKGNLYQGIISSIQKHEVQITVQKIEKEERKSQ